MINQTVTIPARVAVFNGSSLVSNVFFSGIDKDNLETSWTRSSGITNFNEIRYVVKRNDTVLLNNQRTSSTSTFDFSQYDDSDSVELCVKQEVSDRNTYKWSWIANRTIGELKSDYASIQNGTSHVRNVTWWGVSKNRVLLSFEPTDQDWWNNTSAIQYVVKNETGVIVNSSSVYDNTKPVAESQSISWSGTLNLSMYNSSDIFEAHVRNTVTEGNLSYYNWYNITGVSVGELLGDIGKIPPTNWKMKSYRNTNGKDGVSITFIPLNSDAWNSATDKIRHAILDGDWNVIAASGEYNISLTQNVGWNDKLNISDTAKYPDGSTYSAYVRQGGTTWKVANASIEDLRNTTSSGNWITGELEDYPGTPPQQKYP